MNPPRAIDLANAGILEIAGPDALRFLNGQITQDLGLTVGADTCLPSFVTDPKGRMQFHIHVLSWGPDRFRVLTIPGEQTKLEERLSRHLIADDAEITDISGAWRVIHVPGPFNNAAEPPPDVVMKNSARFGPDGVDWWFPAQDAPHAGGFAPVSPEETEHLRISHGIPHTGRELLPDMLVQEIGINAPEFSYNKGCYIGQEVISRVKSAGKLNRSLKQLRFDASLPTKDLSLVDAQGQAAGTITSVSPLADGNSRAALAFVKSSVTGCSLLTPDGARHEIEILQ
jgi:folate-binding protein YgfZ